MSKFDRRTFLQMLGAGTLATALQGTLNRALAIKPHRRKGTIADVEHIVILTQENRSFDHYFGTLSGVRGFGDPRVAWLASGNSVWSQPDGNGGTVLPFRPAVPDVGAAYLPDPPHGWNDSHAAWNGGQYDNWVPSKGASALSYLKRSDIPFHFALADAFTICDAYHCSLLGPTDPNRYHLWTGWTGNDGNNGGPVLSNAEVGYDWSTYPERLQKAGITWKVYQDQGAGLTADQYWGWGGDAFIGNYGDNSLLYFHQYQNAPDGSPLAVGARTGTNVQLGGTLFDAFRSDVVNGTLPQVSYIAAPEAFSEHPNWPAAYGAWYIGQLLDALTANPEVWSKTVFLINWDENGGFFDHVVPPSPPASPDQGASTVDTINEVFAGDNHFNPGPYGLGVRVPLLIVSPWTKGGWVNSQVFDHTSVIRFIEARFAGEHAGLIESNITPWRRAVAGDLTSAFNFAKADDDIVGLPDTSGDAPADNVRHPDDVVVPPVNQSLPTQDRGVRRARALPYELSVRGSLHLDDSTFRIRFDNTGSATAVFQVRSTNPDEAPRSYTVEPGKHLSDSWQAVARSGNPYDLTVFGPNGFGRTFQGGDVGGKGTNLDVRTEYDGGAVSLVIKNRGEHRRHVTVVDTYTGDGSSRKVDAGDDWTVKGSSKRHHGWYGLVVTVDEDAGFQYSLAGHVETGKDSVTDPAIAGGSLDDVPHDG